VIARVLTLALAAAILVPATAQAAATRAIQSVSLPSRLYWEPQQLNAQQGDTVEWRMTEPGNANAAVHDVWLIKPGADPSTAVQLGATWLGDGNARSVVDQVGTYSFYCSIHGGLAPGERRLLDDVPDAELDHGCADVGPDRSIGEPFDRLLGDRGRSGEHE